MGYRIKFQKGFLLIVAAILITVIAVFGSTIAYMYLSATRSSANILLSNTAFYIATSGLEMARRAILVNGQICNSDNVGNSSISSINNSFTNVSFPFNGTQIGNFSVTTTDIGTTNAYAVNLSGNITNATVNITLNDTTSFVTDGVGTALVESEIITYPEVNTTSKQLINTKRGAANTTAVVHPTSPLTTTLVHQHMCVLKSAGQVAIVAADGTTSMGKRVLREPIAMGQGYIPVDRSLPGLLLMPAIISAGGVSLKKINSITNSNIDGRGCAIAARSSISTGSSTLVCKSGSSSSNIWSSDTEISNNSTTFFSYFFDKTLNELQQIAQNTSCTTTNSANINTLIRSPSCDVVWYNPGGGTLSLPNLTPDPNQKVKILIVDNNLVIPSGVSMTNGEPVKIIVKNNFDTNAGANNIYGFFYVQNVATLRASTLYGAVASFGNVVGSSQGGLTLTFTPEVFERLSASSARAVQSASEVFS